MNTRTHSALLELAAALAADPDACEALAVYGSLPDHLADAISDLEEHGA